MSEAAYDKPTPPLNRDSKPYWDSLQEGSMRLQSCANCGKVRHYPRALGAGFRRGLGRMICLRLELLC